MQDRYAGDIGDFGKLGFLRELRAAGFSIGINWYKTEIKTEKNTDGRYTAYSQYRECDPELYDALMGIVEHGRSIATIEDARLIEGCVYYDAPVPVTEKDRTAWQKEALKVLHDQNLVFLDPDNGLIVDSVSRKSEKRIKYALYDEVLDYLEQSQTVIIYNHRSRKQENEYFHSIEEKLINRVFTDSEMILKISFPRFSVRDYFVVCPSIEHVKRIREVFKKMNDGIWRTSGMCRLPENGVSQIDDSISLNETAEARFYCTLRKETLSLLRKYCLMADTTTSQAIQKILDENLERAIEEL